MKTIEIHISDIIIQHPEINSFNELMDALRNIRSDDMLFLDFDVKPDFRDTPRDWKLRLEGAFAGGLR